MPAIRKTSESITKSSGTHQIDAPPSSIGCVIMASGFGRRFGSNKLLADFCGKPMISHILNCTASVPGLHRLVVTRYEETAALCRKEGVEVLCHTLPSRNDTIRLGLEKLLENFRLSGCIFCPADQPLLSPESFDALLQAFSHNPDKICRLCYEDKAASPVIFGQKFFQELLTLPPDAGGSYLAKKYPAQVILVPARDPFELYDVDTPEALQNLSEFASAHLHPQSSVRL